VLLYFGLVSATNIFDALLALLFVFLALILLVHRLVWPLLARTLFRMQDIGTKGRRGVLVAVGLALLAAALHVEKFSELFKKIIEKLAG
jgi:hypothetical protein